ncbi:MAG: hypothetical protein FD147_1217 [Chloroflexi bacterium]|nr:MAG: hypothetical protein FD147_1217 [Chloroflexota bacterium]
MIIKHVSRVILLLILAALSASLTGCRAIRPVRILPAEGQSPLFVAPTFQPTSIPVVTPSNLQDQGSSQPANCANELQFIFPDITYPDGSQVSPGAPLDKQWQVKNSGTCNWDENYSLHLTAGIEMGAASPQALVPARSGAEAVVRIQFTAPTEPGRYRSAWQAFGPNGQPFGDPVYIEIVVITQ